MSLGDGSLEGKKRKSSTSAAEPQPKKKPRRRRRKVRADDDNIELSSSEIRGMLKDTSSIVKRPAPFGAEESDDENAAVVKGLVESRISQELYRHLSYEELFQRPGLADDGQCAPELINLWKKMAKIRDTSPREDDGSVEHAREAPPADDEDGSTMPPADDDKLAAKEQGANEVEDDNMPMPGDDDDQGMPIPDDEEAPMPMPDDDEEGMMMVDDDDDVGDGKPSFSLGMEVNEWDYDEEEENRQEAGDELVSSTAKWHKNTIK